MLIACASTTIAGCWLFGCCDVTWRVTRFGFRAGTVCAISVFGVLALLFMSLTIYHFFYRIFVQ